MNPFRRLWALGYRRLCPILPPDAPISPRSSFARRIGTDQDPRGKAPGVRWPDGTWSGFDFVQHESTEDDLDRWAAMGAGAGIKTGDGLVLIDADTLDEQHARIILDAVTRRCGALPVRIGRYPKAGYLARTDPDFTYRRIEFGARDDKGRLKDRVEILAEGRQFVAIGTHPATGKPYRWPKDIPALDDVPFVPGETLQALLEELKGLLPQAGDVRVEGGGQEVDQASLRGDMEMVRKAVEATPNTSALFPSRESYRDYGYAIKAAAGPDNDAEALGLFLDWCARWQDGDNDPGVAESDWRRMKPPYRRGASWLYEIAEAHGGAAFPPGTAVASAWFEQPSREAPLFPEDAPNPFEEARTKISATPYRFTEPTAIPPRRFLYGRHYIRQFVSATVAPSGVGKSSLIIAEALCMATGKPLLGQPVAGPLRVWLWNGEDPLEEMERRIAATMMHYGLTREDVGDRLFLDTGRSMEIVMAVAARDGAKIAEPVAAAVEDTLRANVIDVMVVDPFVSSHRVTENDNGAIDMVTKRWARIADGTGCAIELVHHVRKLNGGDVTVEDSRGAVALLATARSKRALAKMTKSEAMRAGAAEIYQRLFRVGDERNNLALPAADDAAWFELKTVALGNGSGSTPVEREMSGDQVGVVALRRIERKVAVDGATGEYADTLSRLSVGEWRRDQRAGDAWAGVAVAQAYGLNLDEPADKAEAKRILADMLSVGALRSVSRNDAHRKMREYVEVCAPDNMSEIEGESAFD